MTGSASRREPVLVALEDLRLSPTAVLFEGGEDIRASMFVTRYERGQGPRLHRHPYPETFLVQAGTASFTIGAERRTVTAGHLLVVPAETPHRFECAGDDVLHVVSVHPSPVVEQENL